MGVSLTSATFWVSLFSIAILQSFYYKVAQVDALITDDDHSGFISIDCGSEARSYFDQASGLTYTWDDNYIKTGKNMNVSLDFNTSDPRQDDLYMTVRSFSGKQRSCYSLSSLLINKKYLIRARFMYGNYDGRNTIPRFDVYIGVNFWRTIKLSHSQDKLAAEIIHYSVTDSIDVCLVENGHGTPFISALELRPLDDSIYNASSEFSLNLWKRWDVGRSANSSEENDDAYNRLWDSRNWPNTKAIQTNQSSFDAASSPNPYKVPTGVLRTACELNVSSQTNAYNTSFPTSEVYAYWHFAELELLASNDTREFYIYVPHGPGYKFGPVSPKYLQSTTVKSDLIPLNGSNAFVFSLNKTDESTLYPILNAVEMYKVLELSYSPTNQDDVDAVTAIKNKYAVLQNWQGDPCLPKNYQWDGLICAYDGHSPPRITSLNLSSRNLNGEIPPTLSELKFLMYLNLSNNGFTGKIPDFLAEMPSLSDIDLTGNNLTGPVPLQLAQKYCNKSIFIRLDGISISCQKSINKKSRRFIIPLVTSIASVLVLVIIGIIFFTYNQREKKGLIYRTIRSRNKRFRYSDIVKITDSFKKIVGKGAFGTVYHGLLQDGTAVAVKRLNNTSSALSVKQFCAEAELLTKIHHVNLVSLIGYCDERLNMALVYEYLPLGDLKMHLSADNNHSLSWKTRLQISIDAAQGLEYLHSGCQPTIIHRDVKPANILLDEMGHAKISDFGLSRFFTTTSEAIATTDIAGTLGYLDPEYCQMNTISDKSDVFGFGVVLLELITGKPVIFKQVNQTDEYIHIVKWATEMVDKGDILEIVDKRLQGDFSPNIAWKFLEIAMDCVNLIGNQRPRMSEVVAELKLCYASEGYHDQNDIESAHNINENGYIYMSQPLDRTSISILPEAR